MSPALEAIYKGIGLGTALCIGVGPSFFALIQTSLSSGVRHGIALALGIFMSDLTCVLLAYLGVSKFMLDPSNQTIVGLIGGTILILFGIYILMQKKPMTALQEQEVNLKTPSITLTIMKGFLLNILNPVVIILWITWLGVISSTQNFTRVHVLIFFGTTLSVVVLTDILKVMMADRIKQYINPHFLLWVNRLIGTILLVIGIWKLIALLR
ncbi:MAG TPA: LysE family translocator [Bacteroidia bacterium]|jgi:threonine/homoserine/homoserine lactone efflux protein|nr:LysE family translocator [Bacteroidia bacterium]